MNRKFRKDIPFKILAFETDLRDEIGLAFVPHTIRYEYQQRDIPEDVVILAIHAKSLPPTKQTRTAILFSRKNLRTFIDNLDQFEREIRDMKVNKTKTEIVAGDGGSATIIFNLDNTVTVTYTSPKGKTQTKKGITLQDANSFLKKRHFTAEIAELRTNA